MALGQTKSIAISSLSLLTAKLGSSFASIFFTAYFARHLLKSEFAVVAVFDIFVAVVNMVSNFGIETYCTREIPSYVAKGKLSEASGHIKTALVNRLFWSGLLGIIGYIFSLNLAYTFFDNESFRTAIQIMIIGAVFASMNTSLGLIAHSVKAFRQLAAINFIITLSYCLSSLALYSAWGFHGWVCGFSLSRIIGCISFVFVLRKWIFYRSGFSSWFRIAKSSFPYYFRGYAKFGLLKIDQVIIGIFMTPEVLSGYYIAKKAPGYISIVMEALARPLLTRIAEYRGRETEKIQKIFTRISRYNSFIFVPLCLGMAAFGNAFLELLGGYKYTGSYPILVILCLAWLVKCLSYSVYENGLFVFGVPSKSLFVDMVGCISNILFLLIFVPFWHVKGVAIAFFLSIAAAQLCAAYMLNSIMTIYFDYRTLFKVGAAMLGFVFISASLQILYYRLWLIPLYFLISSFAFWVVACNFLEEEDINLLNTISPKVKNILVPIIDTFRLNQ